MQSDEISSHRDGSARFAVLSAQLNNVQPGQVRIINLYAGPKTTSTPSVPANPDWNLEVETQLFDAQGNVTATLVAQPQAQLKTQIANNNGRRMAGAVASEYTVVTNFKDKYSGIEHPHLTARFHTRLVDAGARIRTDVVMENTRTWTTAPSNISYSMVIKRNGTPIHTQAKFTHYHHARWHKAVWTGSSAEPLARVRHHMPYFVASKATWNYNLGIQIQEASIANLHSSLQQKRAEQTALGPMGNAMLAAYFPTTGGRPEIGPVPRWTATYLISQDDRAREVMFANADASAGVPVHFRDEGTGQPLDLVTWPNVSVKNGTSQPSLPGVVDGTTIWNPDVAHQASFSYVPYLLTGDAFYLDEMMFWTAWNVAALNPGARGNGKGTLGSEQVRGWAWGLRSMFEAAAAIPDSHAQKNYYQGLLSNNLDWLVAEYPNNAAAKSPLHAIDRPYMRQETGPWQNDFLAITLALIAENGDSRATTALNWFSKFNLGRFMNEANGFCINYAAGYYWRIKDSNNNFIQTWQGLAQENEPGVACSISMPMLGYPEASSGYAAVARAMMASSKSAGVQNASQVFDMWVARTPNMDKAFPSDPTWAIVPR